MYTIIILVSIVMVLCIAWGITENEFGLSIALFLWLGVITFMLSFFFLGFLGTFADTVEVPQPRITLSALKDNSSIEGQFYLFGGTIEGVDYYHYIEQKDGYKQRGKIKAEGVKIFEDGGNYIQKCENRFKNEKLSNWLILLKIECPAEIHIPENSVTTQYNIDLE